ncbi:MAG: UDP-N-acetylglucosamine 2-epimerase (non-hydrolyzing) [Chitinispirillales bacterium]|jgi:UDP-N-acetylglucosamine 2-epimerase (non-hydrolysing)|nr:UDP-N-acetylglucosamine 2-epimerase (non-hydrolyzing) [Chitinispirillales bacterium]
MPDINKILFIYGTRPEAIKMAPLIKEFQKTPDCFDVKICLTGQHRQMLDQTNAFFDIVSDYDLNLMSPNQTLFDITALCLSGLKDVFEQTKPDIVFVQGDTTSVMVGALASFYKQIPVAHLEAGLRSGCKYSPFPEEINRIITGHIADYHFAPTSKAVENLKSEGITKNVYMVGNTVIDALHLGLDIIKNENTDKYKKYFSFLDFSNRIILVTGHRRENFGDSFENICSAIAYIANVYKDVQFVYPMHFNPNVREPVNRILKDITNVHLIEPLDYPYLIWLMEKCYFVLTDSGGIQEEAPALGKPVLVMRDVTERQEGIEAGTAKLVGTKYENLVLTMEELLNNEKTFSDMANAVNPYGDGTTSQKIVEVIKEAAE